MSDIPDDFHRLNLPANPFIELCGPLYGRRDGERLVVGLRVRPQHCNPGKVCHGGMLMTLADMALLLSTNVQTGMNSYLLTVQLSTDFLAPAPLGSWIESRVEVLRQTRNLLFSQGLLSIDGTPIARISGLFKPLPGERGGPRREPLFAD